MAYYSERIRWGSATVDWDGGERYTLEVPHTISESWTLRWLGKNLLPILRTIEGCERLGLAYTRAGDYSDGSFEFEGFAQSLLPPTDTFRRAVDDAVSEAERQALGAQGAVKSWLHNIQDSYGPES